MRETVAQDQGVLIDVCLDCKAVWLDLGELDQLTPAPDPVPDLSDIRRDVAKLVGPRSSEPVRYRMCPVCDHPMSRRHVESASGILVDDCPRHGVFLDAGELEAIQEFVRRGGRALGEADRESRRRSDVRHQADRADAAPYTGSQPVRGSRSWEMARAVSRLYDMFA